MSKNIYISFKHNSPKLEAAQLPINSRKGKYITMKHSQHEYFTTMRKQTTVSCNDMNKSHRYLSKKYQMPKFTYCIILYRMKIHIASHIDYTNLPSHQQCARAPFSPHPQQHLSFAIFVMFILTSLSWYLTMVLVLIFLWSIIEHLFIYLLVTCMSIQVLCLF
jgi:hypothetical protein